MIQHDESFGIIPLRLREKDWEVFLIQHSRGRYWGFPKGHAEHNESHSQAAIRELKEETNLDVVRFIHDEPLIEQYQFIMERRKVSKSVYYFIAEVSGEVILQKKEIANGIWLSFRRAYDQITHAEGRSILRQVEKILSETLPH